MALSRQIVDLIMSYDIFIFSLESCQICLLNKCLIADYFTGFHKSGMEGRSLQTGRVEAEVNLS